MPKYVVLMLLAVLVSGCATHTQETALEQTLNAYASTVRWGDMAAATQFIDPARLQANPPSDLQLARYQHVRVTGYDTNGPVPTGDNEVRQRVQINLINIHTQRERRITDEQVWKYDAEAQRWWLQSGLPDITP